MSAKCKRFVQEVLKTKRLTKFDTDVLPDGVVLTIAFGLRADHRTYAKGKLVRLQLSCTG